MRVCAHGCSHLHTPVQMYVYGDLCLDVHRVVLLCHLVSDMPREVLFLCTFSLNEAH